MHAGRVAHLREHESQCLADTHSTAHLARNDEQVPAAHKNRSTMGLPQIGWPVHRLVVPLPAAQLNSEQGMRHRGRPVEPCIAVQAAGVGAKQEQGQWAETFPTSIAQLQATEWLAGPHMKSLLPDWKQTLSAATSGAGGSSFHAHLHDHNGMASAFF